MEENDMKKNIEVKNNSGRKYDKGVYFILIPIAVLIVLVIAIVGYAIYATRENEIINTTNINQTNANRNSSFDTLVKKPIIYIYPTETKEVEVKLGNPQYLSCTYPKYEDSWKVTAKPNGDLIDKKTGRNLYALYWEGENIPKETSMKEGFCVKGEDTVKFLEEKLSTLGLSDREAEEFVVYWLPKMEDNNYNYIRFETMEEQKEAMPLEVTPKPDNIIRVMMDWKRLDEAIDVKEQTLETPSREGYTVVEWGGSELN